MIHVHFERVGAHQELNKKCGHDLVMPAFCENHHQFS